MSDHPCTINSIPREIKYAFFHASLEYKAILTLKECQNGKCRCNAQDLLYCSHMKILVAECPYCQPLHYPSAAQTFVSKEISSNGREDMFKVSLHFQLKRRFKTVFCCSRGITNKFYAFKKKKQDPCSIKISSYLRNPSIFHILHLYPV